MLWWKEYVVGVLTAQSEVVAREGIAEESPGLALKEWLVSYLKENEESTR